MVKLVCIVHVVRMHHVTRHVLGKVWMRAPVRGPSASLTSHLADGASHEMMAVRLLGWMEGPKGALVRRRQISPNVVIATEFLHMLRALLAACTAAPLFFCARALGGVPGAWLPPLTTFNCVKLH